MALIVKRKGHKEEFDEKKVYASCYFAARNCHYSEKQAEELAQEMLNEVSEWLLQKDEVNSLDIFIFLVRELKKFDEEVSFMYETHMDIN